MESNSRHTGWKWQEYGTPWTGPAIYHVTLSVADHRSLLGKLVIPSVSADSSSSQNPISSSFPGAPPSSRPHTPAVSSPFQRPFQGLAPSDLVPSNLAPLSSAYIERSDLGKAVVRCMARMSEVFPQIRLLKYTVMESHVHFIIHVTESLPVGIQEVLRRFWRSCEKEAYLLSSDHASLPPHQDFVALSGSASELPPSPFGPDFVALSEAVLRPRSSHSDYPSELSPLAKFFPDRPYIRPLSRKGQLPLMVQYVERNPARLATKHLYPEYFHTMRGVEIAGRRYDAVGNMAILLEERARSIHVHLRWTNELRDTGRCEALRTYMNECVLSARDGVVQVSPCVNPHEREVMDHILGEGHRGILILTHGMTEFYQPAEWLREACAGGGVLILSPWGPEQQEDVGRAEFVHLNAMADEIVAWYAGK